MRIATPIDGLRGWIGGEELGHSYFRREILEFGTQFVCLTEFDTQFADLSEFDTVLANSFSLGVFLSLFSNFSLSHFLFNLQAMRKDNNTAALSFERTDPVGFSSLFFPGADAHLDRRPGARDR